MAAPPSPRSRRRRAASNSDDEQAPSGWVRSGIALPRWFDNTETVARALRDRVRELLLLRTEGRVAIESVLNDTSRGLTVIYLNAAAPGFRVLLERLVRDDLDPNCRLEEREHRCIAPGRLDAGSEMRLAIVRYAIAQRGELVRGCTVGCCATSTVVAMAIMSALYLVAIVH